MASVEKEAPLSLDMGSIQSQPVSPMKPSADSAMARSTSKGLSPGRSFTALSPQKIVRVSMVWDKINLSVMVKDAKKSSRFHTEYKKKQILNSISGRAESGELLAIMGPTGCGKTSLMNILAARVSSLDKNMSKLDGNVYINGALRNDSKFRRVSAYVLQDDSLFPHLTVHETLLLAAHFYLPDAVELSAKEELVTSVINELGLGKTRDTCIGNEKVRGVSGGERKRANIAVQLISNPAVLFLDEPTSGLDSFQSQAVMEAMKNMSLNNRLVISVIHQPRSSIYDMFDKLLLLSEGHAMYLGNADDACKYFESKGFPAPRFFNPADFFLDILSPDARTSELDEATCQRIADLSHQWNITVDLDKLLSTKGAGLDSEQVPEYHLTLQRFIRNFKMLFWRSWSETARNRAAFITRIILSTIFSCIIGGMYNNLSKDQTSIYNREGMLFIIGLNQAFNAVLGVAMSFPQEKVIVNRERSANAYDTFSYFVAKFFAELPTTLIPGFIFGTIVYWIAGLRDDRYGIFILILMLEIVTATTIGLAVSSFSPNKEFAVNIAVPIVIIAFVFAGFYINLASLPLVAKWVPYASFLRWAFQAFCINEFSGQHYECTGGANSQCLSTGEAVLQSLSFERQTLRGSVLGLSMILVISMVSAVVLLDRNRLTFLPLNIEGSKHRMLSEKLASAS